MRPGTKSILVGVHQFAIHPLVVAFGWYRAFGFRRVRIGTSHRQYISHWEMVPGGYLQAPVYVHRGIFTSLIDPRLWLAFLVHDIGLFGKPNIDGPEGETHPEVGAAIMRRLFGEPWGDLVLLHSRYYAKRLGREPSPLCIADKWAILVEPSWLYLPRARWSGELAEYMAVAKKRAKAFTGANDTITEDEALAFISGDPHQWHRAVRTYMRRWIDEHADGKPDTWTRVRHGNASDATAGATL